MAERVWTAAELESMTPAQRREIFEASIITDLDQAPEELLARTRAKVEKLIEESERPKPG